MIGVGLGICGSVFSNLGVNIQKHAFMKNDKLDQEEQKPYFRIPQWYLGLCFVILGAIGDFTALGFAAQSIVAPIGSTTLVVNLFFAHFWLQESLPRKDLIATLFIVAGAGVCALMGDHADTKYSLSELLFMYQRPSFIAYAICVVIVMIVLFALTKHIEPLYKRLDDIKEAYDQAKEGSPSSLDTLDEQLLIAETKYAKWEKIHPFCYCALSGLFGAQDILFGKMVAELVAKTIAGENQMQYGLTYVFIACMVCSVICQLHFLAQALNSFDALYCIPVFQCVFIGATTLAGGAYFQEFVRFSTLQAVVFPIGVTLTLGGVLVLSQRKMGDKAVAADDHSRSKYARELTSPYDRLRRQSARQNLGRSPVNMVHFASKGHLSLGSPSFHRVGAHSPPPKSPQHSRFLSVDVHTAPDVPVRITSA